ncbi:unnamed protein product [Bursaphelenchus xylophilus]|uniref:(pine wood nematode) hypothetical protein n=1 Tax=Bursaphelenchus xylophilus TaxID=6326 RepID=A0A1I7RL29_BURXY|nr:unnamed protein product [Bursaphelenchus xylophilus]CAG9083532.1 unnamed protein product [Bursaphelenchus xylophilus]
MSASEKCICQLCECGNHRCPHENSGRLIGENGVPFGGTEYGETFVHKKGDRERGKRSLHTSLGRDRDTTFDLNTTHRSDFTGKKGDFVRAGRPLSNRRPPSEAFGGQTTHRSDYQQKEAGRSTPYRPEDTVFRNTEPLDGQTIHRRDFIPLDVSQRSLARRPASGSRHLSSQPFEGLTEHREQFDGRRASVQRVFRPENGYVPNTDPLDATTTYKEGFTGRKAERALLHRPFDDRLEPTDPFDGTTTHRQDYNKKENRPCPAGRVLARADRNYEHVAHRDGHRFYRRVGLSSGQTRQMTRVG